MFCDGGTEGHIWPPVPFVGPLFPTGPPPVCALAPSLTHLLLASPRYVLACSCATRMVGWVRAPVSHGPVAVPTGTSTVEEGEWPGPGDRFQHTQLFPSELL